MIKSLVTVLLLAIVAQASWREPVQMDPPTVIEELTSDSFSSQLLSIGYNYPGRYIAGQPENTPGALIPIFFVGTFEEDTIVRRVNYQIGAKLRRNDLLMIGERVKGGEMVLVLVPIAGQLLMLNVTIDQVIKANTSAYIMKLDTIKGEMGIKLEDNRHDDERLVQERLDGK